MRLTWHPGFAPSQKKKNIAALHESAARAGYAPLLEVSTKSEEKVGQRLSAFNLKVDGERLGRLPLESARPFGSRGPRGDISSVGVSTPGDCPSRATEGLTFRIDMAENEVCDMSLEDYCQRRKEVGSMRMLSPPHPGDFIRTEIIGPRGLPVTAAAQVPRVSRPALASLLNGKAGLSGDMALRVEKAFGVKMDTHAGFLRHRADSEAGGPDQGETVAGRAAAGGVRMSSNRVRLA